MRYRIAVRFSAAMVPVVLLALADMSALAQVDWDAIEGAVPPQPPAAAIPPAQPAVPPRPAAVPPAAPPRAVAPPPASAPQPAAPPPAAAAPLTDSLMPAPAAPRPQAAPRESASAPPHAARRPLPVYREKRPELAREFPLEDIDPITLLRRDAAELAFGKVPQLPEPAEESRVAAIETIRAVPPAELSQPLEEVEVLTAPIQVEAAPPAQIQTAPVADAIPTDEPVADAQPPTTALAIDEVTVDAAPVDEPLPTTYAPPTAAAPAPATAVEAFEEQVEVEAVEIRIADSERPTQGSEQTELEVVEVLAPSAEPAPAQ